MFRSTGLKQRWWLHRDQKIKHIPQRDTMHIQKHPNAFAMSICYQSSLYLTDCEKEEEDSFICCPGSHLWEDGDGWENSSERHHVSVPYTDTRVKESVSKLIVKTGEMIIWDSRIAHMGGYLDKISSRAKGILVKMVRLDVKEPEDMDSIKASLNKDGVCIVKIADVETVKHIKALLCEDISNIYNLPMLDEWNKYPSTVYGRANKGGGSWGPIACGRAAWEARLLPQRIKVFQSLLGMTDIVVSIDSVHWNIENHTRLSFMASFCPRNIRSNEAYKRKCISQAYGLTRTTHWANVGDISKFNYGSEHNRMPQERYEAISKNWKGHGSNVYAPEELRNTYVKQIANIIAQKANQMTIEEVSSLLDPSVSQWL